MDYITDIYVWQLNFVRMSYERGHRTSTLGPQPAPWMFKGLKVLEDGKPLTVDMIKNFNT